MPQISRGFQGLSRKTAESLRIGRNSFIVVWVPGRQVNQQQHLLADSLQAHFQFLGLGCGFQRDLVMDHLIFDEMHQRGGEVDHALLL